MSAFASGSTNHELEDEDFSLVYCASCRKDAVDAASGRLREDDFCIVECCQAGQSGLPCVVDQISIVADVPASSPDKVSECVVCRAAHPRFVVLSHQLPPDLVAFFKPVHKLASTLVSAAIYQHASQSNHMAFLKKTCFKQRDSLNQAKARIDQITHQLTEAHSYIAQLETRLQQQHPSNIKQTSTPVPLTLKQPSFAASRGLKRKTPSDSHASPRTSTRQRLGLDTNRPASTVHPSSKLRRSPRSSVSDSRLSDHVQQYVYEPMSEGATASDPSALPNQPMPNFSSNEMPPPPPPQSTTSFQQQQQRLHTGTSNSSSSAPRRSHVFHPPSRPASVRPSHSKPAVPMSSRWPTPTRPRSESLLSHGHAPTSSKVGQTAPTSHGPFARRAARSSGS